MRTVPSYTDGTTLFVYRWKRIKWNHPSTQTGVYRIQCFSAYAYTRIRMRIRSKWLSVGTISGLYRVIQGYLGFIQGLSRVI